MKLKKSIALNVKPLSSHINIVFKSLHILNINKSYRNHILVGLSAGVWLVFFLIVIAPFDIQDLDLIDKLEVLPPYGLIFFVSYLTAYFFQRRILKYVSKWNLLWEIITVALVGLIAWPLNFGYYQSDWINGEYSFDIFSIYVYLPIMGLILPIIFFGRWLIAIRHNLPAPKTSKVLLKGTSKGDLLRLDQNKIICISSAHNYVEVYFMQGEKMSKHLIRSSLSNLANDLDFLVRIHRSHIINPAFFQKWKDSNTISLGEISLPVSKSYKDSLLARI